MKKIASAENPRFKSLRKLLHSSRARRREGIALLDGIHLVAAYCERVGVPDEVIVSLAGLEVAEIRAFVATLAPKAVIVLSDSLFKQLSTVETPTGIMAAIKTPQPRAAPSEVNACVMLEDIQDPGNLGSILRTSAAAGIGHVLLSAGSVHAWSPRVLRAAMGAHFALEIHEHCDLPAFARAFKGKVVAASPRAAQSVFDCDLTGKIAFAFGNEGAGLSKALADEADAVLAIPTAGKVESLNAAAAAAVCLFERVRQLRGARGTRA